eukprot:scaffold1499_cov255-Pinguiococcus_pyrenoidosus.AAC.12
MVCWSSLTAGWKNGAAATRQPASRHMIGAGRSSAYPRRLRLECMTSMARPKRVNASPSKGTSVWRDRRATGAIRFQAADAARKSLRFGPQAVRPASKDLRRAEDTLTRQDAPSRLAAKPGLNFVRSCPLHAGASNSAVAQI